MSGSPEERAVLKPETSPKQAYQAPKLVEHGSLAKLTRVVKSTKLPDGATTKLPA